MNGRLTEIAESAFRFYLAQDRQAAWNLYGDDFRFTSPQDDRIDKDAYFARCFPTADRFSAHRRIAITSATDELILAYYEYTLVAGGTYRNMEAITVRDELIRDVQVFFGGQV